MSNPSFAVRRPVTTFLLLMYPLAWALAFAAFALRLPTEPSIAVANFVGVLGPAVLVSYWIGRGAAVRRLFAGILRWRVNVGWYLFAVLAMPLATIPISLATGSLPHTAGGWAGMCLTYLISLLVGAVFTNLWEEVAWAGFVQSRLTARRGLILGAVITGPLFAAQHLPIVVAGGGGIAGMLVIGAALVVLCVFFRYLIGATLIDTGGSLLVVGILHASSDASGAAFGSGWQQMIGGVAVALMLLAYRAIRRRPARTPSSTVEPVPATI
jgi:membrane protease YdiL (CAAX protease family)